MNKKYIPLLFAVLTFVITFLANYNVYLSGDDYFYITFTNGTVSEFFTHHINHYLNINGRAIVHFLVSVFLSIDLIWWKIFNSIMLASIVYFGSKITSKNTLVSGAIFFLGICGIGISVSRQSIYWLTGSFNYVYPIFMLFIYWYFLLKYYFENKHTILLSILAFLSSATVEQGGMMVFGLTLLLFVKDYIKNKRIDKNKIIVLGASFFGIASVILSPATFVRYGIENAEKVPFLESLYELVRFVLNSFVFTEYMLPINVLFSIISFAYLKTCMKKKSYFLKILPYLSLINIFILIYAVYFVTTNSVFDVQKILVLTYVLFVYVATMYYYVKSELIDYKNSNMTVLISNILLIGCELMLAVTTVYGTRNLLFGIFMMFMIVASMADKIYFDIKSKYTWVQYAGMAFLIALCCKNQFVIVNGYYKANLVEKENISIIEKNVSDNIVLYKHPDENYTWSAPYISKYHEGYYKKYYGLENVEIEWR